MKCGTDKLKTRRGHIHPTPYPFGLGSTIATKLSTMDFSIIKGTKFDSYQSFADLINRNHLIFCFSWAFTEHAQNQNLGSTFLHYIWLFLVIVKIEMLVFLNLKTIWFEIFKVNQQMVLLEWAFVCQFWDSLEKKQNFRLGWPQKI